MEANYFTALDHIFPLEQHPRAHFCVVLSNYQRLLHFFFIQYLHKLHNILMRVQKSEIIEETGLPSSLVSCESLFYFTGSIGSSC